MKFLAATLALAALPLVVAAHHSRAEFSLEMQEIEGELVSVDWSNPHPTFTLQVLHEDQAELWQIQGYGSIYTLTRAGVTGDYFAPGDRVRLAGQLSTRRERLFLVSNALISDGIEVVFRRDAEPRWSETGVGGEEGYVAEASDFVDAATENRGIFRLWSRLNQGADSQFIPPLTAEAAAVAGSWDAMDDTSMRCIPKGVPWMMQSPHPYEFVDEGDVIKIRGHEFNIVRTVHMNDAGDPSEQPPSPLGYSVGRWEGNTLVVETSRINSPWFSGRGIPLSEAVEVVERFTLSDDQSRLDYRATTTDPATFTAPAVTERYWGALGETVETYECKIDE